jgi:hypothetical protein
LVQTAIWVYSKKESLLGQVPYGFHLLALMRQFTAAARERGYNTVIYEEPDPGAGDREVVRHLNDALAEDPETQLPPGYKRVIEKEIELVYSIPEEAVPSIPEPTRDCLEILDDVLSQ